MLAPQLVFTLLIAGCLRLLLAGRLVVVVFAVPGRVLAALLDTADVGGLLLPYEDPRRFGAMSLSFSLTFFRLSLSNLACFALCAACSRVAIT